MDNNSSYSVIPPNFPCLGKTNYIKLREMNFHYLSWGDESKPLMIMLHGFMDHSHTFDLLSEKLMNDYYIVAWDARGFGKTDWIHRSGYYHFFDYLYDLESFIEYFKRDKVILVGHSMGGIISTLYAGTFPEKVSHLISLEGWFIADSVFAEAPVRARRWVEEVKNIKNFKPMKSVEDASIRLRKTDHLMSIDISLHLAYEATKLENEGYYWRHDPLHRTRTPQQTYLKQIEAFWEKINCPVLLLKGEKTTFSLLEKDQLEKSFKNMSYFEIENAGHNLHLHQPTQTADLILDFLSSS